MFTNSPCNSCKCISRLYDSVHISPCSKCVSFKHILISAKDALTVVESLSRGDSPVDELIFQKSWRVYFEHADWMHPPTTNWTRGACTRDAWLDPRSLWIHGCCSRGHCVRVRDTVASWTRMWRLENELSLFTKGGRRWGNWLEQR